jgi:hypothetical protein
MKANVSRPRATVTVSIESRCRVHAAGLQTSAENIRWHIFDHSRNPAARQLKIDASLISSSAMKAHLPATSSFRTGVGFGAPVE